MATKDKNPSVKVNHAVTGALMQWKEGALMMKGHSGVDASFDILKEKPNCQAYFNKLGI